MLKCVLVFMKEARYICGTKVINLLKITIVLLAYAWLKNRGSLPGLYEARRAGHVNRETRFVLHEADFAVIAADFIRVEYSLPYIEVSPEQ